MRQEGWSVNGGRLLTAVMMLLAATIVPLTPVADAQVLAGTEPATEAVWEEGSSEPTNEIERWWGVLGAAICGGEIRLILRAPAIGMNPYVLAAGIAGCGLAALDVLTTQ